jgi:peptidoglycan/LPS O-acetylase OafA/YrhL
VNHGFFGVEIFFGVSGFVILMTLERCRTPADFVFARCLRLYPAYWVAVAATFAVMTLFPLADRTVSWPQAMVQPDDAAGVCGHSARGRCVLEP